MYIFKKLPNEFHDKIIILTRINSNPAKAANKE
jgi:hypothetical protein